MDAHFLKKIHQQHISTPETPSPRMISNFFVNLLEFLFPERAENPSRSLEDLTVRSEALKLELHQLLTRNPIHQTSDLMHTSDDFFERLPYVHSLLEKDIEAMFLGDPAAKSKSEVVRSYPGFYAIAGYRVANELYKLGVQIIPRIITEYAHGITGIDIHPTARIGEYFCIDHGTGIVIGGTTVIGDHVKIYQGVTLGALSVDKKDAERKRHPTIEDHVVIYAGATILGGETTIGHNSIIGGNVWITRSIPPNSKIYYQAKMHNSDTNETDLIIFKENLE